MFGWFKSRKSDLYYELELALQDKSRWTVKKDTHRGYWVNDSLTGQEWLVDEILDDWYVASPTGLDYRYSIGALFYRTVVKEFQLNIRRQTQEENKERERAVLKQYQEVKNDSN